MAVGKRRCSGLSRLLMEMLMISNLANVPKRSASDGRCRLNAPNLSRPIRPTMDVAFGIELSHRSNRLKTVLKYRTSEKDRVVPKSPHGYRRIYDSDVCTRDEGPAERSRQRDCACDSAQYQYCPRQTGGSAVPNEHPSRPYEHRHQQCPSNALQYSGSSHRSTRQKNRIANRRPIRVDCGIIANLNERPECIFSGRRNDEALIPLTANCSRSGSRKHS